MAKMHGDIDDAQQKESCILQQRQIFTNIYKHTDLFAHKCNAKRTKMEKRETE